MSSESSHHVHFDEFGDNLKSNEIFVKSKSDKKIEIQLGFLQVNHVYEVNVIIPRSFFPPNCDLRYLI